MALGSYVAGSTPMGGDTVGFPVLVLMLDQPATLGRDFSFAVQSIGMTSAAVFIVATGRPVAWRMLGWATIGSAIGTPLGLVLVAPFVSPTLIKMLFAVVWASFGVMTLLKLRDLASANSLATGSARFDRLSGLAVGLLGGACVASVTGVGVDMIVYTVLVLIVRADLKMAIPTSVIMMAVTSLIGVTTQNLLGRINTDVFNHWLAAAPIVALGAPFGAIMVNVIGRTPTLAAVAVLCLGQFVWTCYNERAVLGWWAMAMGVVGVLAFNAVFHVMYHYGHLLLADSDFDTDPETNLPPVTQPGA